MNKKLIKLTEQDLHRIVKESAKNIIKEWEGQQPPQSRCSQTECREGKEYL